jgi:uncharacterized Zn finger protein
LCAESLDFHRANDGLCGRTQDVNEQLFCVIRQPLSRSPTGARLNRKRKGRLVVEEGWISVAVLESLAGGTAFRRGEAYFSAGAVRRLYASDDKITAQVEGSETYQVELWDDEGDLAYHCTCPRAAEGYFCKHCVALGLAWLAENSAATASGQQERRDPWQEIKSYLSTQAPDVLIDLLLDVAQRDERLYQRLWLKAELNSGESDNGRSDDKSADKGGSGSGHEIQIQAFRRAIDAATHLNGFVDWREVGDFAATIEQVVDSLAELLKPDTADLLVELAEYAIDKVEHALEQVDDSNGEIGDLIYHLGELHLQACTLGKPEPAGLAERLFHFETALPFGLCSFDASTYREALGEAGLRRYRELAEAAWNKLPPRGEKAAYDDHRWHLTRVMEKLAEASGDVEALVAIKSQDLSSAYRYLNIAEIWDKAGQPDKSLEWAERGLHAFPESPDNRLRDFLVAAYLGRQRHDEALQLTWIQFEETPTLETYKKLKTVAEPLGLWPEQRQRALARATDVIARAASTTTRWRPKPSAANYSLLLEIALWEQDLETAWSVAHQGDCERNLLITLAGKLESSRQEDALSLYRRVVPLIVEQTNNAAYEEAIRLMRKMGRLMQERQALASFTDYLAALRLQFKLKRNFIKLLDDLSRSMADAKQVL